MIKWRYLIVLVWLALPVSTPADTVKMNDFAYGVTVDVPPGVAVAALNLPEAIYRNAGRKDLGDIRVFNASGEPVPHHLRHTVSQSAEPPWRALPYFPIPEETDGSAADYRVYVRTEPDGAMVRVQPHLKPSGNAADRSVLIDANQMNGGLAELRLAWQPQNRMAFFSVAASDDLVEWQPLQSRAVISDIDYGGHRLNIDTIHLPPTTRRYLRLRRLDDGPALRLTAVSGQARPEGSRMVRAYLTLDGRPVAETPGAFAYNTGGAFPVDRVNLQFSQPNSMAQARLASRGNGQAQWTRRFEGLFYRIDIEGTPVTRVPQPVAASVDRLWRLVIDASESTIGQSIPRLTIGYRPHDLYFMARGNGPFTLAFGSSRVQPLKADLDALVQRIRQQHPSGIERWVSAAGPVVSLGGVERLAPPPQPLPTRRIILWSILLAGVLIVAAMAWHLARRLKP